MEILALGTVFVAAAVVAIRWARSRPARFAPLIAAIAAAAGFVLVRDHYSLEDSAFLLALSVFCSLAGVIAAAACVALRQGIRGLSIYVALAVVLVPVLFGAYLTLRLSICLVTGCDQS
jgi:hypothetical protein